MFHSTEVHTAGTKMAEYLAGWQRARAELINLRNKASEEQLRRDQQTKRRIIEDLMPLVDNFQAMINHLPPELNNNPWAEGVLHVYKQIEQLLAEHNVEPIKAKGAQFDPGVHEAVDSVKNTRYAAGYIVEVLQAGYKMDDQVIRPAKVKVAK